MTPGIYPFQRPANDVSKQQFIVSLFVVLLLHLPIFWFVRSPPTAPIKPKPPSFAIELGKAPPASEAGQEAVGPPAPPVAQAFAPPKAVPTPPPVSPIASPTVPPITTAKSPAELPPGAQTLLKAEQQSSAEPPAQPQTTTAAKAEPAQPTVQGSAKASIESVRTAEPDYKAAYLNNPRPPYPSNAHRFGIEGQVILQAEVNEEGVPLQVRVFQSSGNDLLDESALSTVTKWRFSPARKDGAMVRAVVKIPITFSLKVTPR